MKSIGIFSDLHDSFAERCGGSMRCITEALKGEDFHIEVCPGLHSTPHTHDFLELTYVTKGKALHVLNGEESVIEKGDYLILDYNAVHSYDSGGEPFEIINCLFYPKFIDKSMRRCKSFENLLTNYLIRFQNKGFMYGPSNYVFHDEGSILRLMENMLGEYARRGAGYLELLRCNLIEIIIQTLRHVCNEETDYGGESRFVIKKIERSFAEGISLSNAAKELNCSLAYLSRRFKDDTGLCFRDYLQKTRIEQGCRLLANTDKKIIEVAELCGYADVNFFSRIFKKWMNMTPGEFRKMY